MQISAKCQTSAKYRFWFDTRYVESKLIHSLPNFRLRIQALPIQLNSYRLYLPKKNQLHWVDIRGHVTQEIHSISRNPKRHSHIHKMLVYTLSCFLRTTLILSPLPSNVLSSALPPYLINNSIHHILYWLRTLDFGIPTFRSNVLPTSSGSWSKQRLLRNCGELLHNITSRK